MMTQLPPEQGLQQAGAMAMQPHVPQAGEIATTAAAAQAVAAVQARYAIARANPRSPDQARVQLLAECKRLRFAQRARYRKPVGGGFVEGPSIRFVEAALLAWGNVYREARISYETAQHRAYNVALIDLEKNVTHHTDLVVGKVVERRKVKPGQQVLGERLNSYGSKVYLVPATEDELDTKAKAQISKAIRELGLRLLPPDLVDEAEDQCIATMEADDAKDPDAARKRLADAFLALGVQPVDLQRYLGHPLAQCSPKERVDLLEIYNTIKDGGATWSDYVQPAETDAQQAQPAGQAAQAPAEQAAKPKSSAIAAKLKARAQ